MSAAATRISQLLAVCWLATAPLHGEESLRFDIERYAVAGNSVLDAAALARILEPHAGRARDFGDLQRALEALEREYRRLGYAAVQVHLPEQEIAGGVVTLNVVEPLVERVLMPDEALHFDAENLRRAVPSLREGGIVNALAISDDVTLANEHPSRHIEIAFGQGEREGTLDARYRIEEQAPLRFFLTLDNTGNKETGEHRLGLGVRHANLFNRDHQLTAALLTSPEKSGEVLIGSLSYRIPVYETRGLVDFSYAYSSVNTATTGVPLEIAGKGNIWGVRYTQLLPRAGSHAGRLFAGLDVKQYDTSCQFSGVEGCDFGGVNIGSGVTLRTLTLGYAGQIGLPGRVTDYGVAWVGHLGGGPNSDAAAFAAQRTGPDGSASAQPDYQLLRVNFSHQRAFAGDWQWRLLANAQWTEDALLPQEQFSLAGQAAVRGLGERVVTRDRGIVVQNEWWSPLLALPGDGSGLRGIAFVDAASGQNLRLAGEGARASDLVSVGVGLRGQLHRSLAIRADYGRVVAANDAGERGRERAHFSLIFSY